MRVKSRWNYKEKEHTIPEIASALAFNAWRIGQQACLNLENEGFETTSQSQRLDVIAEFLAFLLHYLDRHVAERMPMEQRAELLQSFAGELARHMQDNRRDVEGPGDYKPAFIELLNARHDEYAEYAFDGDDPGFALRNTFGQHVAEVMGEHMRRWIPDQVEAIEVPEALAPFRRALRNLLPKQDKGDDAADTEGVATRPDPHSLQANNTED
ncbi:MAG: hypothetical protein D6717_04485 [Gammaproteobacteria bacterium]|nr:MAG: hypothetical protein D6717_04485 [Gammaproteobacteria bacterium]